MNYQYIEQLLDRYWECETTLEEEQILRSFFSQPDVPENLKQYASLFLYEASQKEESLGKDFDERMLAIVSEETAVKAKTIKLSSRFAPLLKAAAVVAVVLTIGNVSERALQTNSIGDVTVGEADSYTKKEDITAKIKIIDQNKSAAIAKNDSLNHKVSNLDDQQDIIVE